MAKITNTGGAVKKNPLRNLQKSIGTQRLIALLALIIPVPGIPGSSIRHSGPMQRWSTFLMPLIISV